MTDSPIQPRLPVESIEVAGIRFTAPEVRTVEIERDGRTIRIEAPVDNRRIGFGGS